MSVELILAKFDQSEELPEDAATLRKLLDVAKLALSEANQDPEVAFLAPEGDRVLVDLPDGTAELHSAYAQFSISGLSALTVRVIFEIANAGDMVIITEDSKMPAILMNSQQRSRLPAEWQQEGLTPVCHTVDGLERLLRDWYGVAKEYSEPLSKKNPEQSSVRSFRDEAGRVLQVVQPGTTEVVQLYRFDPTGNDVPAKADVLDELVRVAEADLPALGGDASVSRKESSLFTVTCRQGSFDIHASYALFYVYDLDEPTIRMLFDIAVAGEMSVVFSSFDECLAVLPSAGQMASVPRPWVDRGDIVVCDSPRKLLTLLRKKLDFDVPLGQRVHVVGEATWAPGTRPTSPASIMYIEAKAKETATKQQKKAFKYYRELYKSGHSGRPLSGLMMAEFWQLATPSDKTFYAYRYGGDKEKWRKLLADFASLEGRNTGEIVNFESFVLDDGHRYPLGECRTLRVRE